MNRHRIIAIILLIAFVLAIVSVCVGIAQQQPAFTWPGTIVIMFVGLYTYFLKRERDRADRENREENDPSHQE